MIFTLDGTEMLRRLRQPKKALRPMLSSPSGSSMDTRLPQFWKIATFRAVRPDGRQTVHSNAPPNALSPMLVTLSGMYTLVILLP